MSEKKLNTRIQQKHDIEANWLKAVNFVPMKGEIIVYDPDDTYDMPRVKVGDGVTLVSDLPFAQMQADWNENNSESLAYVKNRPFYWELGKEVVVYPEKTFYNETDYSYYKITMGGLSPSMLNHHNHFIVVYNGVRYPATVKVNSQGYRYLSSEGKTMTVDRWGTYYLYSDYTGTSFTYEILGVEEAVFPISEKYLPQGVPNVGVTPEQNNKVMKVIDGVWSVGEQEQADWNEEDPTSGSFIKNKETALNSVRDFIVLRDQVTGLEYMVGMRNGDLVTYSSISYIEVTTLPSKTEYVAGTLFDPTGMVVKAVGFDGYAREISGYTYTRNVDSTSVEIRYVERGITYTTTISVTLTPIDPSSYLVDFEYVDNGDGSYTLTDWKQTLNSVASTELVIPDNSKIIL